MTDYYASSTSVIRVHDGVEVTWSNEQEAINFTHSFNRSAIFERIISPNQMLVKACKNKQRSIKTVLDLTGGWGIDSFILAYHGKEVTLLEKNNWVFSIVSLSIENARLIKSTSVAANRITPIEINSLDYLNSTAKQHSFDCIYLDPMFPNHKSTAKPGKSMQLLQKLTENVDIESCFDLALKKASNRVVVKRPLKSGPLTHHVPNLSYREKTVRFDIYLTGGGC